MPHIRLVARMLLVFLLCPTLAQAAIVSALEEPADGSLASGVANLRGWAFTTTPGAHLVQPFSVSIDGTPGLQVPCCGNRADVMAAFPDAPLLTGFSTAINWGNVQPGSHTLTVTITDSAGGSATQTSSFTTSRIGDLTFVNSLDFSASSDCSFGNDTALGQSATFSCSGLLLNFGTPGAQQCSGDITFGWDRASQTYKLRSGCN